MVLDRDNLVAYACLSPRTNTEALKKWCLESGYSSLVFHATDIKGNEIYHTNVMMCIADKYAVVCLDSVKQPAQKALLAQRIELSGKKIVGISLDQMNHFAGNMLQVNNDKGERLLVMSSQAYHSLTAEQIKELEAYNRIVHSPLNTIEMNGGGSARCMMAEVHLPLQTQEY
jgi:hypothetical protein